MIDQYGDAIPDDLVLLDWDYVADCPSSDSEDLLKTIDNAPWYELFKERPVGYTLAISWSALNAWQKQHQLFFDPTELADAGIPASQLYEFHVFRVSPVLHRWDEEYGYFYHA